MKSKEFGARASQRQAKENKKLLIAYGSSLPVRLFMVRHKFERIQDLAYPGREIPRRHASTENSKDGLGEECLESVYKCASCGEYIILPPPKGFTKTTYLRRIGIVTDCDLQKVKQVMKW